MAKISKPEQATQQRVIALIRNELGYRFVGDRTDAGIGEDTAGGFSL